MYTNLEREITSEIRLELIQHAPDIVDVRFFNFQETAVRTQGTNHKEILVLRISLGHLRRPGDVLSCGHRQDSSILYCRLKRP